MNRKIRISGLIVMMYVSIALVKLDGGYLVACSDSEWERVYEICEIDKLKDVSEKMSAPVTYRFILREDLLNFEVLTFFIFPDSQAMEERRHLYYLADLEKQTQLTRLKVKRNMKGHVVKRKKMERAVSKDQLLKFLYFLGRNELFSLPKHRDALEPPSVRTLHIPGLIISERVFYGEYVALCRRMRNVPGSAACDIEVFLRELSEEIFSK